MLRQMQLALYCMHVCVCVSLNVSQMDSFETLCILYTSTNETFSSNMVSLVTHDMMHTD